MMKVFDSIKKIPHPEEAAKQLSRRTHGADPGGRRFPDSLLRGGDEGPTRRAAMSYYPAAFLVDKRNVIGAWLVCLFVAAVCFGSPLLGAAFDTSAATRHAVAGCEHLDASRHRLS